MIVVVVVMLVILYGIAFIVAASMWIFGVGLKMLSLWINAEPKQVPRSW